MEHAEKAGFRAEMFRICGAISNRVAALARNRRVYKIFLL
jgi:hypothetical protein